MREGRNQDGGPATAVFAFSLEREREIARQETAPSATRLLAARLALIDEVQAYRETGRLTLSLLQACETELELAPRSRATLTVKSVGMKRLCELAADGHQAAADIVRREFSHVRSDRRLAAYDHACASWFRRQERASAYLQMLADRSGDLRQVAASGARQDLLFELIPAIEAALANTRGDRARSNMFFDLFDLKERARLSLTAREPLPPASEAQRDVEWRLFKIKFGAATNR